MPDADYWRRRYERAEAGRLAALEQLRDASHKLIDIAADEQQQQIDALERQLLNRAALVSIEPDGNKLRFMFVRRGAPTVVMVYNSLSMPLAALRKELLED